VIGADGIGIGLNPAPAIGIGEDVEGFAKGKPVFILAINLN
jgi:hypothetical protein